MLFDEDSGTVKECEACVRGKMKKETFSKQSEHRAIRPDELIHSNLCGPMQVESKGGSKYILTFTDDHTRYTTAYFIKSKRETLSKFTEYVHSVDKQADEKVKKLNILTERNDVKIIRSNNGGESAEMALQNSAQRREFCTNLLTLTVQSRTVSPRD